MNETQRQQGASPLLDSKNEISIAVNKEDSVTYFCPLISCESGFLLILKVEPITGVLGLMISVEE